ncbi:hypothetical protein HKD37_17G047103 [Glycine soja]
MKLSNPDSRDVYRSLRLPSKIARGNYGLWNLSMRVIPLTKDDCEPITEPGAYIDTSYEEIIKIDDFEENSPSSIHISDYKVDSHSHDLHALGVQNCGANDLLTHSTVNEERLSRELSSGEVTMLEGLSSSNYELNDVTGDEN